MTWSVYENRQGEVQLLKNGKTRAVFWGPDSISDALICCDQLNQLENP